MKVILASNNSGKIKEMQSILQPLQLDLVSQATLNISEIEETGLSFVENALLKARHASKEAGRPAIADDSGLCVEALFGAPGIYSARYAGMLANSKENIQKLLNDMAAFHGEEKRKARFYCVIVLVRHATDPVPIICQAAWEGALLTHPRGTGGFGYDPIFYLPKLDKTAAELSSEEKNKISHRGQALKQLIEQIKCNSF